MIVKVVTLGCKVNQVESASIVEALNKKYDNIKASEGLSPADVYILNTCSVTAEADRKSRQYISKMTKLNPDCNIIVIGCSSQNDASKFKKSNVYAIGGTQNKDAFVFEHIDNLLKDPTKSIISNRILYQIEYGNLNKNEPRCCNNRSIINRTRAFIKIQDGCNRFCSYCIIPYLRGRSESRSINDIVRECDGIRSGEIVLTGIDMSVYGKDIGCDLTALIKALRCIPSRKRLGSLECEVIDESFLKAMNSSGFCPHFHLSLQSGSGEVLRSMNRHYTPDEFYEKIQLIRSMYPYAGITTDIIVGFPTETEDLFEKSCDFIEKCAFSDIHVFPYSARKGTVAANKYKTLPKSVVDERVDKLFSVKKRLHKNFIEKNIGQTAPVYVEDNEDNYNVGYTPNYIKVYSMAECGKITDLKLTRPYKDGVIGE